ncbi:MAG: cysteine hydrolase [Acidobacteriaceae bacterium]|nr:cysteine hydrolase [Acidobacteriaceae bacterium]
MKTVFVDVDTQIDFLFPAGALYVPGAEEIVENLATLTRFAAANSIPVISTADAHNEDDAEFKTWKPHCVLDTVGQQKAAATLLQKPLVLSTEPGAIDRIADRITDASQIIVEKQALDCFTNPNLRPLLDAIRAERYVVYGVVTELCVQCAAFGLLKTGANVELVTDAVKSLDPDEEHSMLDRFQAHGGVLTTVAALTG